MASRAYQSAPAPRPSGNLGTLARRVLVLGLKSAGWAWIGWLVLLALTISAHSALAAALLFIAAIVSMAVVTPRWKARQALHIPPSARGRALVLGGTAVAMVAGTAIAGSVPSARTPSPTLSQSAQPTIAPPTVAPPTQVPSAPAPTSAPAAEAVTLPPTATPAPPTAPPTLPPPSSTPTPPATPTLLATVTSVPPTPTRVPPTPTRASSTATATRTLPTRAPTVTPRPTTPPPTRGTNCDPSYPDVCIPPPPPDLDCPQIPYRNFRVIGRDPHRFDGDRDGIGCESGRR